MEVEKLFELMTNMYSDMRNKFKTVKTDISSFKSDVSILNGDVLILRNDTSKNGILLEAINKKLETLYEIQQSFQEQLGRESDNAGRTLNERFEVIELAVSHTSDSINSLADSIDVIKNLTGRHEIAIKILEKSNKKHSL